MSILTLQFGPYANFVGSHFWNLQDELSGPAYTDVSSGLREVRQECLYRTGDASTSTPATPNVLIFDAAGSEGLFRAGRGSSGLATARAALQAYGGGVRDEVLSRLVLQPHPFLSKLDACQEAWDEEGDGEEEEDEEEEREAGGNGVFSMEERDGYLQEVGGGTGGGGGTVHLDPLVHSWGDFCKATLHPRSLVGVGGRSTTGEGVCTTSSSASGGGARGEGLRAGTAAFHAFTDGMGLIDEGCEDRVRWALEGCDSVGGFQVVTDVNSGWGGFALDVAAVLRDECPRVPMLVLGVSPPSQHQLHQTGGGASASSFASASAGGSGESDVGNDPAMFARRKALQMALCNTSLAYTAFAATGDLDCTFMPLSYPSTAGAGAGAASTTVFPGLLPPTSLSRPYQTSAHVAVAWDCATLPYRRNAAAAAGGGGGGAASQFTCPATGWGGQGDRRQPTTTSTSTSSTTGGREGSSTATSHPLISLPATLHMREYLGLLRAGGRAHTHRVSQVGLCLPFPHPAISPTQFGALLSKAPPPSLAHPALFQPMSYPNFLSPPRVGGGGGGGGNGWNGSGVRMRGSGFESRNLSSFPSPTFSGGGGGSGGDTRAKPPNTSPFAHAVIMRGVGSGYKGGGGSSSSSSSYSSHLDTWMARDGCRESGHVFMHTPLPLPITMPRMLPRGRYTSDGGLASTALQRLVGHYPQLPPGWKRSGGWPPTYLPLASSSAGGGCWDGGGGGGENGGGGKGVTLPFSMPCAAHVATSRGGGGVGGAVSALLSGFKGRDTSFDGRFGGETSGVGGGAHTATGSTGLSFSDVADGLAELGEQYCEEGE